MRFLNIIGRSSAPLDVIRILYPKSRQMASRQLSGSDGDSALARDVVLALIVGFLTGALSIPVVINLGIGTVLRIPLLSLPIIVAVLFAIALLVASLVASRVPSLFEFSKFAVVGVLNSGVDFGILNLLILITGVASGGGFFAFKSVSVTLGVINSYVWNKYWTFDAAKSPDSTARVGCVHGGDPGGSGAQRRGRGPDRERNRRTARIQPQALGKHRRYFRRRVDAVRELLRLQVFRIQKTRRSSRQNREYAGLLPTRKFDT